MISPGETRPLLAGPGDQWAYDPAVAGAKGGQLIRMRQAGLPVPETLIVTTEAWVRFFRQPELADALRRFRMARGAAQAEALKELRRLVRSTPLPADLRQATSAMLPRMGPRMAVRSSAVAEDGGALSFAGMLSSYLGLQPTWEALSAGVKAVWLSLLSRYAVAYLEALGEHPAETLASGCAVVVQPVQNAERSGVLFRHAGRVRIEAVYGLGLPLVAGKLAPDEYEWDGQAWRCRLQSLKRAALVPTQPGWEDLLPGDPVLFRKGGASFTAHLGRYQDGISVIRLGHPLDTESVLSVSECTELHALADRVAECLGMAELDLEWAWVDGRPILLQARPVTATLPSPIAYGSPGVGLGAAPGVADGVVWVFGRDREPPAAPFILTVPEVAPEHIRFVAAAAGVIAASGSVLCHGAILCRELGKPLVIMPPGAPMPLPNQRVRIDGLRGSVELVETAEPSSTFEGTR